MRSISTGPIPRINLRTAARVALVPYLGLLARFTLWPESTQRTTWQRIFKASAAVSSGRIDPYGAEKLANIALFLPFGVLAVVALGGALRALAAALSVSGAIELAQHWWLPSRDGNLRDVALNVLGAALGCTAVVAVRRVLMGTRRAPSQDQPTRRVT
jgi:VanZ family protein